MTPPSPSSSSGPGFDPGAPAAPGSGLFGLDTPVAEAGVHVIPVPFDATTSFRKGAARGPAAILHASRQVELFDRVNGRPYEAGIAMLEADPRIGDLEREALPLAQAVIDVGGALPGGVVGDELRRGLERVNAISAEVDRIVHAAAKRSLAAGALPCVLGGDHAVPFGAIAACGEAHAGLGVLHFDAHHDLRPAYEGFTRSHASILYNVVRELDDVARVVQVGIRDFSEEERDLVLASEGRVRVLYDDEWAAARMAPARSRDLRALVRETLALLPDEVYVTFDVDGLDPALCPNTGTPVPGGLDWNEARLWLEELGRTGKRVVGLDLVEVAPDPEAGRRDGIDAIVGARLLYQLIGTALLTRK